VALEGRRLDKLEEVVGRSTDAAATLGYALRVCQQLVINRDFRQQVCVVGTAAVTAAVGHTPASLDLRWGRCAGLVAVVVPT
jgi:hypothetical protein